MTLVLEWFDEREAQEADEREWRPLLERLLRLAGEAEGVADGIVSLTLTDDEGIRELNRQYRNLDRPTDVLSFPLRDASSDEPQVTWEGEYETVESEAEDDDGLDPSVELLGDIVISVPRARAQAAEYGHSVEREIGFLFVHGFLHLLGYDHETEAQEREMFARQEAVLQKAGLFR
jgi:probable rRNA maturation factor